jgi:hypothetical protein
MNSTFRRRSAVIWAEQTDTPLPETMHGRMATVAWLAWARAGNRWPNLLARAVSRAKEEAHLFNGDPLTLLVARPLRMMARRPRGKVVLYPRRERLRPEQLAGFGSPPFVTAAGASPSTGTPTCA